MPYSINSCSCIFFLNLQDVYCCLFWMEKALPAVCALASSIAQLSPGEGQHYAATVQVHFTRVIFYQVLDLSFCDERPLLGKKDICSVNQKWQFVTVLWDREGERGKWSWTLHYGGAVVSHYSPRNPDLQIFANECELLCPQGFVWRWGQDCLNALCWRRASFLVLLWVWKRWEK